MIKHIIPAGKSRKFNTKKRRPNSADGQVGESIRAHRLAAGMSQAQLGKRLGVSFQQVQKYEKGTNRVGAGRLPQIAAIFGVPIGALFNDTIDATPGKGTAGAVPVGLVADAATIKLLTAFSQIVDRSVRSQLSGLVERIANSAKNKSRR
jgi:transcriptional regulator with XRE-family HTH domain